MFNNSTYASLLNFVFVIVKTHFFIQKFGSLEKSCTFAPHLRASAKHNAEIAQLVEHNLAKVGVASSSLVFRSNIYKAQVAEW